MKPPTTAGKEEREFAMLMQRVYPKAGSKRMLTEVILATKETISKGVARVLKLNTAAEAQPSVLEANNLIISLQGLMVNYAVVTHLRHPALQPGRRGKERQKEVDTLVKLMEAAQKMQVNPLPDFLQAAVSDLQAGKEQLPPEPLVAPPAAEDSNGRPAGKAKAAAGKAAGKPPRASGKKGAKP